MKARMNKFVGVAMSMVLFGAVAIHPAFAETAPRFADNGNSTNVDTLTGVIWTKDANTPGPPACSVATPKTWRGAQDYIDCLNENNYLGFKDWRLPDAAELGSLVGTGKENVAAWLNTQGFTNVQEGYYWTLTANSLSMSASAVNLRYGIVFPLKKTANNLNVWPVRGGGK